MGVSYDLFIEPEVHELRKALPGNVRQRLRRVLDGLIVAPRPANGRRLVLAEDETPAGVEIWRVRLDRWRIVYAVNDADRWVHVLGIYRRPPHDYGDLPDLIERYERVPAQYRSERDGEGMTVDERLVAGLNAAGKALDEIGAKLTRSDLDAFETQGRFIESRYKDGGVEGN